MNQDAQNKRHFGYFFLLAFLVALGYANSFQGSFLLDDYGHILGNQNIHPPFSFWKSLQSGDYSGISQRPLVNLSLAINCSISGFQVWSYHFFNVAIHVFNSLLLMVVMVKVFSSECFDSKESAWELALACSLIWGIHPFQTQAVNYIIQRGELMMTLFSLLTFIFVTHMLENDSRTMFFPAFLSFFLGLFSKEIIIIFPLIIYGYMRCIKGWETKKFLQKSLFMIPFFFMAIGFQFLLLHTTRASPTNTLYPEVAADPFNYVYFLYTQTGVLCHYLYLMLFPFELCFDYSDWQLSRGIQTIPYLLFITVLLGISIKHFIRKSPLGFAGIGFFALHAPTSLFPLPDLAFEYRAYLSSAFPLTIVVFAVRSLFQWIHHRTEKSWDALFPKLKIYFSVLIIISLGFLTMMRNVVYSNEIVLWEDVLAKRPQNRRAMVILGTIFGKLGKHEEARRYLEKAIELFSFDPSALNNLALSNILLGKPEVGIQVLNLALKALEAEKEFPRLIAANVLDPAEKRNVNQLNPQGMYVRNMYSLTHANLGFAFIETNRFIEAIPHLEEALRICPDDGISRARLAKARSELSGKDLDEPQKKR